MVQLSKSDALRRIRRALDEIPTLKEVKSRPPEFQKWQRNTQTALQYTFGNGSSQVEEFADVRYSPIVWDADTSVEPYYQSGLDSAGALLESMIEEIQEYWTDDEQDSPSIGRESTSVQEASTRVFVVHGRDFEGTRNTVVRTLEQLDLEPIVLMEQPNEGPYDNREV